MKPRLAHVFLILFWPAVSLAAEIEDFPQLVIADLDDLAGSSGLTLDTEIVKQGSGSAKWSDMTVHSSVTCSDIPHDWSRYNTVSFWVHNQRKLPDAALMMIIRSERAETEGPDYFGLKLSLGRWTGWKHFLVPFHEFGAARQPIGWQQIDCIDFTAAGWGNAPHPEAVVRFDDLRLVEMPAVSGPRISDRELFDAMNLDYPGMEAVKRAVVSQDLPTAKTAWLEHLKQRKSPKWTVDWRDRQVRKRRPPEGGSDGWDYYSRSLALDWTGWKHFRLEKSDFGASRRPIGWHWIDYIAVNASGWGRTPDPHAVLYFDDIRLVGKGKSIGLGEFETGLDGWRGLTLSNEFAKTGSFSGKWHQMTVNTSLLLNELPTDWTDVEAVEFWCYSPKVTGARVTIVLDSDQPTSAAAESILNHVISGHDFGPDIDWSADPHDYREWTYSINRFGHWRTLAEAYRETGDERYAAEFSAQVVDWVKKNPVPLFNSGNSSYTWRTIECGIRQSTTWPDGLFGVLGSESFSPEVAAIMTASMVEHARHLMDWPSVGGNWLTMESNGLATVGILLPEFKQAGQWRETGLRRQYEELDNQVYPDGSQIELTTGYHQVSLNNFLGLAKTAILNDVPLPGDYHEKLRRMFEYNLYVQMPDGRTPSLNDGNMGSVTRSMATAYGLYQDPTFQWAAARGATGTPPDHASHHFPYAGQMVMRSGWEPDAAYLIMDAGPYGYGHQHEDKLGIMVHALGKVQIIDPGNYHYDASPWRYYTIDTPAHNTIMVDGLPQRRRDGLRSEYIVDEPPPANVWLSSDKLDYAAGQYDQGYGDKRQVEVVHRREVVFVKPDYWLVIDTLSGEGEHLFESMFHFDADEAEIDAAGHSVRTVDPGPNCLIAATEQPGLEARIVKGQTEPTIQGFVAGASWRPSWKHPDAERPEHGKREVPTAVFSLRARAPARMVYVIYPYTKDEKPRVSIADMTPPEAKGGPVRVKLTLPRAVIDTVTVHDGAKVVRTTSAGTPQPWASVDRRQ